MTNRQSGYTIVETAVYLAVFFVLSGAAYVAMYRGLDRSLGLRGNVEALSTTLQAGEHWRADIRKASGPVRTESETLLRIPTKTGEITYRFETNTMFRRANSNAWIQMLPGVKTSQMQPDTRDQVTAWKWEVELLPVKRDPADTNRVHPLFTFIAVHEQKANP